MLNAWSSTDDVLYDVPLFQSLHAPDEIDVAVEDIEAHRLVPHPLVVDQPTADGAG